MDIKDNKTGVPLEHYISVFSSMNPEQMSLKSNVKYIDGEFRMTMMGRPVNLKWPSMDTYYLDNGLPTKPNIRILLARLVMEGMLISPTGRMMAYNEMPWGNVYSAQFDGRCIKRLAFGFGNNLERFNESCKLIAGVETKGGDKAFDIPFLENLIVRLIVWEGDDEFPPSSQILFSDNFPAAFKAEDMAVSGDIILNAMKNQW